MTIYEGSGDGSSSSESKTSGTLLNSTKLVDGYSSMNYYTMAMSEMESYVIGPNYDPTMQLPQSSSSLRYEGEIPAGKKRVITNFVLENKDKTIKINIYIFESDSGYKFKEYFSEMEKQTELSFARIEAEAQVSFNYEISNTRNSIGDHYFEILVYKNNYGIPESSTIVFSLNNKLVSISATAYPGKEVSAEKLEEETLKAAKAIKSKID